MYLIQYSLVLSYHHLKMADIKLDEIVFFHFSRITECFVKSKKKQQQNNIKEMVFTIVHFLCLFAFNKTFDKLRKIEKTISPNLTSTIFG